MITCRKSPDGSVYIEQVPKGKTLYLDLWFWIQMAKSKELRLSFLDKATDNCTIMYSISTMMELATIRRPEHIAAIHEVMDAVDFGFIEHDPNAVVKLENEHETQPGSGIFSARHPAADRSILEYLAKRRYPDTDLRMTDLYSDLLVEIPDRYREMASSFARTMNGLVRRARKSDSYMESVRQRRRKKLPERLAPPYTRDVLQRFLDYVVVTNIKMTRNDWVDMLHLIVPLSYLSLVLADGRWLHFARSELRLSNPDLAMVYGPKEIEDFLLAL